MNEEQTPAFVAAIDQLVAQIATVLNRRDHQHIREVLLDLIRDSTNAAIERGEIPEDGVHAVTVDITELYRRLGYDLDDGNE